MHKQIIARTVVSFFFALWAALHLHAQNGGEPDATDIAGEVARLKGQIELQQKQIGELLQALRALEKKMTGGQAPEAGPAALPLAAQAAAADSARTQDRQAPAGVEEIAKKVEALDRSLGGFRFSGDFRYRFDVQARSSNDFAGPLQNVRSRYRLRLNIDKELDPRLGFHLQLSTGPLNNAITNDQDMAGLAAKHPFSIAEAYLDFRPTPNFALRGGRMEEIFADHMRFLWDDDLRLNGFDQIIRVPVRSNSLGIKEVEIRAGEYILSNPNVVVLPPDSPFVSAGFRPGHKVRSANLFHPGVTLQGDLRAGFSHQLTGDVQFYRNPHQIQLASTAAGVPVLVNNALGIALAGPMGAVGNATTTPGGAMYAAPSFHIVRLAYRLEHKAFSLAGREFPAWLDLQASRNLGAGKLRDAMMVSANLGSVRGRGDLRFLYQFAIKDANALISQFTDDDLGTGSGVNIAVHALRFDLGLTRFLQWQNLLFLQNQRRASNPAEQFFFPLQRGANTTLRYLGQLAFSM